VSTPLWTGNPHVFGLRREHAGETLLLLANFAAAEAEVELDGTRHRLEPYGYRWIA
jgi:hypothetical protein